MDSSWSYAAAFQKLRSKLATGRVGTALWAMGGGGFKVKPETLICARNSASNSDPKQKCVQKGKVSTNLRCKMIVKHDDSLNAARFKA